MAYLTGPSGQNELAALNATVAPGQAQRAQSEDYARLNQARLAQDEAALEGQLKMWGLNSQKSFNDWKRESDRLAKESYVKGQTSLQVRRMQAGLAKKNTHVQMSNDTIGASLTSRQTTIDTHLNDFYTQAMMRSFAPLQQHMANRERAFAAHHKFISGDPMLNQQWREDADIGVVRGVMAWMDDTFLPDIDLTTSRSDMRKRIIDDGIVRTMATEFGDPAAGEKFKHFIHLGNEIYELQKDGITGSVLDAKLAEYEKLQLDPDTQKVASVVDSWFDSWSDAWNGGRLDPQTGQRSVGLSALMASAIAEAQAEGKGDGYLAIREYLGQVERAAVVWNNTRTGKVYDPMDDLEYAAAASSMMMAVADKQGTDAVESFMGFIEDPDGPLAGHLSATETLELKDYMTNYLNGPLKQLWADQKLQQEQFAVGKQAEADIVNAIAYETYALDPMSRGLSALSQIRGL